MKKRKWLTLTISLVLVAGIAIGAFMLLGGDTGSAYAQASAKTGSITSYYSFSGNVGVKDSQSISADANATVREVYVSEKDVVKKGDRLIRLSSGDTIKAGVGGEVTSLPFEKDDDVKAGDVLAEIVNFDNLEIRVKVDEYDVKAVSIGKTALVTLNALGTSFETTVVDFNRQATQSGDISYYMATLEVPDAQDVLPGMQVDVKIMNEHVENTTVISMNALQFDEYNQPFVMAVDASGNTNNVPVSVGTNDGVNVEIVSGVRSGETILVPPQAAASSMTMGGVGGQNGV